MKKSDCLRIAQVAVIRNQSIEAEDKLEILRVLMDKENIELLLEEKFDGNEDANVRS